MEDTSPRTWDEVHRSFDVMGLKESLLRGIYASGFRESLAIQQLGIVPFTKDLDVIQQAQAGTGKIVTLCIGLLQRLDCTSCECQALVVAPTQGIAENTHTVLLSSCRYLRNLKVHVCARGGCVWEDPIWRGVEKGIHVAIGIPTLVLELLRRHVIRPDLVKCLAFDGADEMLALGFKSDMYDMFRVFTQSHHLQVGVFTTTMPQAVLDMTGRYMTTKPVSNVLATDSTLDGVKQVYVTVPNEESRKLQALCDLHVTLTDADQIVVITNSCHKVDLLAAQLLVCDFAVYATHEAMDQSSRDSAMRAFRSRASQTLVTCNALITKSSDHIGGVDVQHISHVINYDLPTEPEEYLHCIGRWERFGTKGVSINFVTCGEARVFKEIQRFYNIEMQKLPSAMQLYWDHVHGSTR